MGCGKLHSTLFWGLLTLLQEGCRALFGIFWDLAHVAGSNPQVQCLNEKPCIFRDIHDRE